MERPSIPLRMSLKTSARCTLTFGGSSAVTPRSPHGPPILAARNFSGCQQFELFKNSSMIILDTPSRKWFDDRTIEREG
jgi:hypothetical protein